MSNEIKSLKDLNPVNAQVTDQNQDTADTNSFDQNTEQAVNQTDEVVESTSEETQDTAEEKNEYIGENEDTTFGSAFDFADSISRRRQLVTEKIDALKEQIVEEDIEEEILENEDEEDLDLNDEDNKPQVYTHDDVIYGDGKETKPVKNIKDMELPSQSELLIDDEDIEDLEDDTINTEDQEKEFNDLKNSITQKLKSVEENMDLTGFTVSKESISINSVLNDDEGDQYIVDWPLMSSGKLVSMRSYSGTEIESMNSDNSRNRIDSLKTTYKQIYDHIANSDKPENFELWLKSTSFLDISHYNMAAYKASFNGANYVPFACTNNKCNHVFLSDDIKMESMIKFKDAAAKEKFNKIMNTGSFGNSKLYETRIIPISNKYAIGFREPSIYNVLFENAVLDQKFVDKYRKVLSMMVYIDCIYKINYVTKKYDPISLKGYPDNIAKTIKEKVSKYTKIINKLPSDNYQRILAIIQTINELGDEITYQLPEVTCPKCSQVIAAEEREASRLLFSRHQLALIANS
jgi:hypothetical protein